MGWQTRTKVATKHKQRGKLEKQLAYVESRLAQIEKVLQKNPNSTAHQRLRTDFIALRNRLRKALGLKA